MGHPPPPLPPLWHEEANPRAQSAERTAREALWVPVPSSPLDLAPLGFSSVPTSCLNAMTQIQQIISLLP